MNKVLLVIISFLFFHVGFTQSKYNIIRKKSDLNSNSNFQNSTLSSSKERVLPKNGGWVSLGLDKVSSLIKSGNNIIAGTYLDGIYLLKNNETSWNQLNNGLADKEVNTLVISDNNIFAGTSGGVFLSSNLCSSWTKVYGWLDGSGPQVMSAIGNKIFYSSGSALYYSTNNGNNWTKCLPDVNALAIVNKGSNVYIGTYGQGVYLSTDDCVTWNKVNTGLTDLHVISLACIGDYLLAGTVEGNIFLSSNNGVSWIKVYSGTLNHLVQCFTVNGSTIIAGIYGNAGAVSGSEGVLMSVDNGYHWSQISDGLSVGSLYINTLMVKGDSVLAGTAVGVYMRLFSEIKVLTATPSSLTVETAANSTNTFQIISNTSWTVSSDQSWLTVSSPSGSGNATITLTVEKNPLNINRTANVTVSGTGITSKTITVVQSGSATEVNELKSSQEITLYPNPSKGILSLNMNNINGGKITITITNSIGIIVKEIELENLTSSYNQEIDLSNSANGVYFISIQSNKTKVVKPIIISR